MNILSIGGWVCFYLWLKDKPDTILFTATPIQNYVIAATCILIFIAASIYTKTWILLIMAFIMSVRPIANQIIPADINKDPFYITIVGIVSTILMVAILVFIYKRSKKNKSI